MNSYQKDYHIMIKMFDNALKYVYNDLIQTAFVQLLDLLLEN